MAAVVPTLVRNKPTHRTFTATGSGAATDTATNASIAGSLKPGVLKTFLSATYANEAAANAAAAAAGIELYAYGAGYSTLLRWVASASTPSLGWTSAAASPFVIGIRGPSAIGA